MTEERRANRRHESRSRKVSKPRTGRKEAGASELLQAAQHSVGGFLRATRESLRMTQAEVAEATRHSPWQLSRAAVSAIERGQNFPGLEAMLALSNVLHIDPKELIERARLTAVVPVDISGLSDEDLDKRASQFFWAGDFRQALSVYDAMVHKLTLSEPDEALSKLATLEVQRATTLKRVGALISAIACAERAISLSSSLPGLQAEAYVVLADLQAQRGHLPLAKDAAARAIDLAAEAAPARLAWAYMVRGKTQHLDRDFDGAKQSFLEARENAEAHGDAQHQSHIAGNIGNCCLALQDTEGAQRWIEQALQLSRKHTQPALEASWLVELGKLAMLRGEGKQADEMAQDALRIARPRDNQLTEFRAEWLRHRVALQEGTQEPDAGRRIRLVELFRKLGEHEGIEEIVEYKESALGQSESH